MGSCTPRDAAAERVVSPEFLAAFRVRAGERGWLTFAEFMALALYDENVGYYRRAKRRVGYDRGTDFFTASTSGAIFGELVTAACVSLLGDANPGEFTFVEIGAEPNHTVLEGVMHPFRAVRAIRARDPIEMAGACVVFSNELFDAQPFERYVFRGGWWKQLGVAWREDRLVEIEVASADDDALPRRAGEGNVFDAPFAAANLAATIARQPWHGLFVAFDYGKSWQELGEATPHGTARAYYRHTQSNDLLQRPGEQDLTCHICWDWLIHSLAANGFKNPLVESQEAFFVRHAAGFLARTATAEARHLSQRKLALMQLLHPAHLGQKFQVLHAARSA